MMTVVRMSQGDFNTMKTAKQKFYGKIPAWLILCLALAAGAGCSGAPKKNVLRFSVLGTLEEYKAYKALAQQYMKIHPKMKVVVEQIVGARARTKVMTSFAGDASADIVDIHYTWFPELAARGLFENLDPYLASDPLEMWDDYFPVVKGAYRSKGTQYGIPLRASAMVFFYNKDMFDRYKLPYPSDDWTWRDFEKTARAVSRDNDHDGKHDTYAFFMSSSWDFYLPWIRMAGGHVKSRDGRLIFDSAEAISVISMFYRWYYKDRIMPKTAEFHDMTPFQSELTAMTFSGPWSLPTYAKITAFNWDLAYIPRHPSGRRSTGLGSTGLVIWSKSKKKKEAWQFMKFLFSRKSLEFKAASPGAAEMPAARPVAYSDLVIKKETPYHEEVFVKSIEFAQPGPAFPALSHVADTIRDELEKMYSIRQDPVVTGKNITRRCNEIIRRAQ